MTTPRPDPQSKSPGPHSANLMEPHPGQPEEGYLYEVFHENTKTHPHALESPVAANPSRAPSYPPVFAHPFPGRPRRALPDPQVADSRPLHEVLLRRRSFRDFSLEPVPLATLSGILHHAYGVTGQDEATGTRFRASPSAGARYPNEIYVAALSVDGLPKGLYHYNSDAHDLAVLREGDLSERLLRCFMGDARVPGAAAVMLITSVFERTVQKYGERGYRLTLLDTGHLGQSLQLLSEAMDLGAVAIGGWFDDDLADLLRVDGLREAVTLAVAIGNRGRNNE